jgi:hypothetical protein
MVPRLSITVSPRILAGFCTLLVAGCAGQVPPSGGPKDTLPPQIVRSEPDTNAVRVNTHSVTLEFSEYVDRRSVEESFFMSPSVGAIAYDWSGKEVTASFEQPLHPWTTYVVTIGTDVKDRREGNRMASSFALAFSTGDSLDRGSIDGRVYALQPEGVMVFAYKLDGRAADTLDPGRVKPDYITQTGNHGFFTLSHLAFNTYRLFAVRDQYRNLLYEKQIDQYGVAWSDINLDHQTVEAHDVWFRLFTEDTSKPFITTVRAINRHRVLVRFSEPIDSTSVKDAAFEVRDTLSNEAVPLRIEYADPFQPGVVGITTATSLDSPATYSLRIRNIRDVNLNVMDTTPPTMTFEGVLTPDTLRPVIRIRDMSDSTRGVPLSDGIELLFSEPPAEKPLRTAVALIASANRIVGTSLIKTTAVDYMLQPDHILGSKEWYMLRVIMDSVKSVSGGGYIDSTLIVRFETFDLRTSGSIAGTVTDVRGGSKHSPIIVTAQRVAAEKPHITSVKLKEPGPYVLDGLQEGRYVLSAYRDADGSGTYSGGSPFPFVPAERFTVYADTIRVRARWGVEGVNLRLP